MQGQLATAQGRIDSLDSEKGSLAKQVTDLTEKLSTLENDHATVIEEKNGLTAKHEQSEFKVNELVQEVRYTRLPRLQC